MSMAEEPTPPAPLLEGRGEEQPTPNPTVPAPALSAELTAGRGKGGEPDIRNSVASEKSVGALRAFAPLPSGRGVGPLRLLHVLTLLTFFGLWTWKLLEQQPVPESISAQLTEDERFGAAKSLHMVGYGFLTILAVMLPVPNYWRWFFVGLLALHGVATEIAQTYIPGRTGRVMDVVIDWGGITLGVLIWQVWPAKWRPPEVHSQGAGATT